MTYYRRKHRYQQQEPKAPVYSWRVNGNGDWANITMRSEGAAFAYALSVARATGYASVAHEKDGTAFHVQRFRRGDNDGHVYTWKYDPERFQDVPVVVADAAMVLP